MHKKPTGQFYAEFGVDGTPHCFVRKDTRVYHVPKTSRNKTDGNCVGVVWMCNPGSAAKPTGVMPWQAIDNDNTLKRISELYKRSVVHKRANPARSRDEDYLLVLNCFYAVDKDFEKAIAEWRNSRCRYREGIPHSAKFVLVAWGAEMPFGLAWQAMNDLAAVAGVIPIFYLDSKLPSGSSQIGTDLGSMYYPVHPQRHGVFGRKLDDLAFELAPFV